MDIRPLRLVVLGLAAVLTVLAVSARAQQPAQRFEHPDGLFSIMLPADAEVRSAGDPVAVKVVSRHGWVLTVQTGPFNPGLDFRGMINKLEEAYLGETKAWGKKIGERTTTVGGLPALEAVYEATRSRWHATIARGRMTDFVIFVSATPEIYAERGAEIGGILATFTPRPEEARPGAAAGPTAEPLADPGTAQRSAAPRPQVPQAVAMPSLAQHFDEPGFGFSIDFPEDWMAVRPDPYTAVFSGREGTDGFFATVSLQNVSPPGADSPVAAAERAFDERRAQMAGIAPDLTYVLERAYAYDRGGIQLRGQEFLATYGWGGQRYSAWVIVLPNPIRPVAHIFAYAAPEDRFRTYQPVAQAMLRSWTIRGTEEAGDHR